MQWWSPHRHGQRAARLLDGGRVDSCRQTLGVMKAEGVVVGVGTVVVLAAEVVVVGSVKAADGSRTCRQSSAL